MSTYRRGRPPLCPTETSTDVHLKLPHGLYDQVYEEASKQRVTVPELIRRAVRRILEHRDGDNAGADSVE